MRKIYICIIMALSVVVQGAVLTENFESYSDGGSINGFNGWAVINTNANQTVSVVSTNGSKVLHFVDNYSQTLADTRVRNELSSVLTTEINLSFDFMYVDPSQQPRISLGATDVVGKAVWLTLYPEGYLKYNDGAYHSVSTTPLAVETWYTIDVSIPDASTGTFDIKVTETGSGTVLIPWVTGLPFNTDMDHIDYLDIATFAGTTGSGTDLYFDNIEIVPEPATLSLMSVSTLTVLILRCSNRHSY